ncbi:hypothetical protein pipiens_000088, partial [Culex pipiens pipiens]
ASIWPPLGPEPVRTGLVTILDQLRLANRSQVDSEIV